MNSDIVARRETAGNAAKWTLFRIKDGPNLQRDAAPDFFKGNKIFEIDKRREKM